MSDIARVNFKDYKLKCKLNWYDNDNKALPVKMFTYQLTQYTPSVYAEITIILPSDKLIEFKTIENLDLKNRKVEIWFEEELYYFHINKSFFPGPFKFSVITYSVETLGLTHMEGPTKDLVDAKIIKLKCIDSVFYNMTLNENFASFGKTTISSVVNKLVSNNGGKAKKIVNTDHAFIWLQTAMTDYNMIRSLLPYSRSSSGGLMYNFFMFNEECYFAPISEGKKKAVRLSIDNIKSNFHIIKNEDYKFIIEQYGNADSFYCSSKGFDNFEQTKPTKMSKMAYDEKNKGNKQHQGIATKYISTALDDKRLHEIYISNVRHRIFTFSKILYLNTEAYPDLTPIDSVEIVNESAGQKKAYDGIYYIASIKYIYGESPSRPMKPQMELVLCSETDITGIENPEGSAT